jgi:hypothetical protein
MEISCFVLALYLFSFLHLHSSSNFDWIQPVFDDPLDIDSRATGGGPAVGLCILRYLARTGTPGPSECLRSHPELTRTLNDRILIMFIVSY